MGRDLSRIKAKQKKYTLQFCPYPKTVNDIIQDNAEIINFIAQCRFNGMIRAIKAQLYKKPQYVWK